MKKVLWFAAAMAILLGACATSTTYDKHKIKKDAYKAFQSSDMEQPQ